MWRTDHQHLLLLLRGPSLCASCVAQLSDVRAVSGLLSRRRAVIIHDRHHCAREPVAGLVQHGERAAVGRRVLHVGNHREQGHAARVLLRGGIQSCEFPVDYLHNEKLPTHHAVGVEDQIDGARQVHRDSGSEGVDKAEQGGIREGQ